MAEISTQNVTAIFVRISGLGSASGYSDLISRSIAKISAALTVETLDAAQAASCEYAAACEAVYEYALEGVSCERLVMSEQGGINRCGADPLTAEGADALRKHAYAELAGFAKLGGFVFETVEEEE